MGSWDRAAQQYFDPPDPVYHCFECGGRIEFDDEVWVDDEAFHVGCAPDEDDYDGEEFLRKMENAADMEAAGVPLVDREY